MKYFTRFTIYNTVYCIRNFLILNPKIRPTSLDTVINHDRIHFPNLCPFHKTFLRFVHKYFFLQYNTLQWTQQRKKCFAFQFFLARATFFPLCLHTVRNLHFLSKNSTLISRENCRFFWVKNSRKCCGFGLFRC